MKSLTTIRKSFCYARHLDKTLRRRPAAMASREAMVDLSTAARATPRTLPSRARPRQEWPPWAFPQGVNTRPNIPGDFRFVGCLFGTGCDHPPGGGAWRLGARAGAPLEPWCGALGARRVTGCGRVSHRVRRRRPTADASSYLVKNTEGPRHVQTRARNVRCGSSATS